MQIPVQVTFRHMDKSEALEAEIVRKAMELDKVHDRVTSCRVVVECQHNHKRHGNIFHIGVDLRVPGKELVVSRDSKKGAAHEDAYVAVRDAFDNIRRQLEEFARRQRGEEKFHEEPPSGHIIELDESGTYGRIGTLDKREIYFHRNSLVNANFDELQVGHEVRFSESMGDEGPQASAVHVTGRYQVLS